MAVENRNIWVGRGALAPPSAILSTANPTWTRLSDNRRSGNNLLPSPWLNEDKANYATSRTSTSLLELRSELDPGLRVEKPQNGH
jgi:hypothetical protein